MKEQDKKEIKEIFNESFAEVYTEVLSPVLDKIMTKLDDHSEKISAIQEDLSDVQLTVNRIELIQRAEAHRVDNHEVRIAKLEKARIR